MLLKYIIQKITVGGAPKPACKEQSTLFLQSYYDKNLTKLRSDNLPISDKVNQYKNNNSVNSVYGEPCGYEVDRLIKELDITESDVFYDLGSGNGNVCATVLFGSACKKAVGIELSDTRHNEAIRIKGEIQKNYPVTHH